MAPHPDFVYQQIDQAQAGAIEIQEPVRWIHDCDHVVRAALFSRALLQLLEQQKVKKPVLLEQMPKLEFKKFEELLLLAVVYHDVVAEIQDKNQEEIQAALYLTRNMATQVEENSLLEVAVALANKNVRDVPGVKRAESGNRILSAVPDALVRQILTKLWEPLKTRFFNDEASESPLQHWLRMILRFGDTVDIVRVMGEDRFDWGKI